MSPFRPIAVATVVALLSVSACGASEPGAAQSATRGQSATTSCPTGHAEGGDGELPGAAAPGPAPTADEQACQLLAAVVVPHGSHLVSSLPGQVFRQAGSVPACTPLVDKARFWETAGDPQSVTAYVGARAPGWLPYGGAPGVLGGVGGQVTDYQLSGSPTGPGWSKTPNPDVVVLTIAAIDARTTGIRIDAQVAPSSASCVESVPIS